MRAEEGTEIEGERRGDRGSMNSGRGRAKEEGEEERGGRGRTSSFMWIITTVSVARSSVSRIKTRKGKERKEK